ncbi:MAG TPA: DUF433 domain-containing protein [Pyrinomonadaceae bacterium]|jgi:uncharacterized protein (DUF433 family)|nr:DUF433 domain-containing protein [Pyrinomonadaceae bacterium]
MKRFNFPETVPLNQWDDGSIRVIGSRVTLDTLVHKFQVGDTFEGLHEGFPSVTVAQIKAIIGWYFDHKAEADEYLREGEEQAEKMFQELASRPESIAFHERLRNLREQRLKN